MALGPRMPQRRSLSHPWMSLGGGGEGNRICHAQICHSDMTIILSWRQVRKSRHRMSSLASPIFLKTEHNSPHQGVLLSTTSRIRKGITVSLAELSWPATQQTLLPSPYLPLLSSYICLPTICHLRSSKSFSFVFSLLYKIIVLHLLSCYHEVKVKSPSRVRLFATLGTV